VNHEYTVLYVNNDHPDASILGRVVTHANTIDQAVENANAMLTSMHPDNYTIISVKQED
jgi:hypothetical protein